MCLMIDGVRLTACRRNCTPQLRHCARRLPMQEVVRPDNVTVVAQSDYLQPQTQKRKRKAHVDSLQQTQRLRRSVRSVCLYSLDSADPAAIAHNVRRRLLGSKCSLASPPATG